MDDVKSNIQLWTYAAALEAVEKGGRMCEGMMGVFRLKYVEGFRLLSREDMVDLSLESVVQAEQKHMTMDHEKDDKRSHEWEMRDNAVLEDDKMQQQKVDFRERINENALVKMGSEGKDDDIEIENLADRLMDVKVGVNENDPVVDGLMEDIHEL